MKRSAEATPERRAEVVEPAEVDRAFEAGDNERAAALIEAAARDFFGGRIDVPLHRLEGWLERLRSRIPDRPWLLFCQGWLWTQQRRLALAAVANARAERLFLEHRDDRERTRALAWVKLAQGVVAEKAGNFTLARQAFAAASELVGGGGQLEPWMDAADIERWRARDPSGATTFYLEAVPVLRAAGEAALLARCLNNLAHHLLARGEPALARRAAVESVELKRGIGVETLLANSLNTLGVIELQLGSYDRARATLGEALRLCEQIGNETTHSYVLSNLAELERELDDFAAADVLYERSLAEKRTLGDEFAIAYGLRSWAVAKRRAGDLPAAERLIAEALRLRDPVPSPYEAAQLRLEYGFVRLALGDAKASRAALEEARLLAEEIDAKLVASFTKLALAALDGKARAVEAILSEASGFRLDAALAPELAFLRRALPRAPLRASLRERARSATPLVRARVLGEFLLEIGGRPVDMAAWRSKRAGQLVRILVAHRGHWVHRDELIESLWPDAQDASRTLNSTVNAARRGLEEVGGGVNWIVRQGNRYRLDRLEWVDADELGARYEAARTALAEQDRPRARERLREAWSLARGEPYAEDRYAEWVSAERLRLVELAQEVRERLAEVELELGNYDDAVLAAVDAVAAEPSRESAHQLLIRAHLARGDRASALRAMASCREALRRELGVAPSTATETLTGSARV